MGVRVYGCEFLGHRMQRGTPKTPEPETIINIVGFRSNGDIQVVSFLTDDLQGERKLGIVALQIILKKYGQLIVSA